MIHDAIIIGAGAAGLSCAHRLMETNADFVIVADTIGGRTVYDKAQKVNFGTYFVMSNYDNSAKLVTRRTRINPLSCRFFDEDGTSYKTLSANTLRKTPGFIAFAAAMATFMRHYKTFKKNCEYMSQRDAMALDPYIQRLYDETANSFIRRHRIGGAAKDYISKFSYACTGVDVDAINALDFCNVTQGLIVPIHRFEFDAEAHRARLGDHYIADLVTSHEEADGIHTVRTEGGQELKSRNIVFATPAADTARLLGIDGIRGTSLLYVEHIRGTLKPLYAREQMNLFPFSNPVIFTAVQDDGTYLVYSREESIDRDKYFIAHELIDSKLWEKAEYVVGNAYIEQQYGTSTYVAGDHNGLGLEPAAISGIYAANQIIKTLTPLAGAVKE